MRFKTFQLVFEEDTKKEEVDKIVSKKQLDFDMDQISI